MTDTSNLLHRWSIKESSASQYCVECGVLRDFTFGPQHGDSAASAGVGDGEAMREAAAKLAEETTFPDATNRSYANGAHDTALQIAEAIRALPLTNPVAVSDAMVEAALAAFDTGTGDPNNYRVRMRAALESALTRQPLPPQGGGIHE